jgi:hypothetical protein
MPSSGRRAHRDTELRRDQACCRQVALTSSLPDEDLVAVGIADRSHSLAPLCVHGLAHDLDAGLAQRGDLAIDVVAVEPERHATRGLELTDLGQPQRELAQRERNEAPLLGFIEPVPHLEP